MNFIKKFGRPVVTDIAVCKKHLHWKIVREITGVAQMAPLNTDLLQTAVPVLIRGTSVFCFEKKALVPAYSYSLI